VVCSVIDTQNDVIMWEGQNGGHEFSHYDVILCDIPEQTTAKSSLFVLYNKKNPPPPNYTGINSLFFIHPNIWKFEKSKFYKISRVHDLYLSSNRSWLYNRPMKALEFLTLLYNLKLGNGVMNAMRKRKAQNL
jgi:hypothetical protein